MNLPNFVKEAVERISMPIEEFREKYAPGSIEVEDTYPSLDDAKAEMARQVAKWGQQNHPSLTSSTILANSIIWFASEAKSICDAKAANGTLSWTDIFLEEVFETIEAALSGNAEELDMELVQCMAVAQSWRESNKRNRDRDTTSDQIAIESKGNVV